MRKPDPVYKPLRVHPTDGRFAVQAQIARLPERWHTIATFDTREAAEQHKAEISATDQTRAAATD